jgi:hypothetical protein
MYWYRLQTKLDLKKLFAPSITAILTVISHVTVTATANIRRRERA